MLKYKSQTIPFLWLPHGSPTQPGSLSNKDCFIRNVKKTKDI